MVSFSQMSLSQSDFPRSPSVKLQLLLTLSQPFSAFFLDYVLKRNLLILFLVCLPHYKVSFIKARILSVLLSVVSPT